MGMVENDDGYCDDREGEWTDWKKPAVVSFTFMDIAVDSNVH